MRFGNWLGSGLQFNPPPLAPWMWGLLLGVPVGIIALYFLKLRRRPVQVPSTLLWRRSIEDLHVNSLFQRLRRNLLLFLQLLVVFLAMLALLGPQLKGSTRVGQRLILAIDNSASMSATDVPPTRLDRAKSEAKAIVEAMGPNDLAMVIAFAESARVVSTYTGNRGQLLERINAIPTTESTTSLLEALQVAAGLANPSRQFGEGDVATEVSPPRLTIFTDGGFPDVEGFSVGNLVPEVVVIGPPTPPVPTDTRNANDPDAITTPSDNVAILALRTAQNEDRPDEFQVFGRVRNFRDEPVETQARLIRHELDRTVGQGTLIDAIELSIAPKTTQAFKFDLANPGPVALEVRLDVDDALEVDNRAYTVIGESRRAQVLLVTAGNNYLVNALTTSAAGEASDVSRITPDQLQDNDVQRELAAGRYDLVIFDGVRPELAPTANALYFGVMPPGEAYQDAKVVQTPIILDWDITHPLLQYVRDLPQVRILKARIVEPPPGSTRLIESNQGTLAFATPREGYTDVVVGFSVYDEDRSLNTDWHIGKYSYPLFLYHCLRVLGNVTEATTGTVQRPGQPVILRADSTTDTLEVIPPSSVGRPETLRRSPGGTFVYNKATKTGIYQMRWDDDRRSAFVVNLFDPRESDLAPRGLAPEGVSEAEAERYQIKIGHTNVTGTRQTIPARQDWWRVVALVALGVVLLEWYIYNRRVYI